MPDQFEQYYKYLKANGADVAPDFNSFKNTLSNYDNASKYYSYLKDNEFDVPASYDSFADTFGLKKKDQGFSLSVSSPTQLLSPDFEKGKAFAEKGFLIKGEGTKEQIEPVEKQGLLLNTVSALDKGFAKNFISSPIKGLGTVLQGTTKKVLGGSGEGALSNALIKYGDYLNNAIDELTPQDEEFKGTLTDQVAQAFGQVGSLIATGVLTGAGKAATAALVSQAPKGAIATAAKTLGSELAKPTAISAGLSLGQGEFDRAKEAGATDDQAFEAFYKNAAVGSVLETIPVMQFFKRFNNSTAGGVVNYIKTKGVAGLTGGIEEMTTEVMQQLYANKTAKDIYNINQSILDGVGTSGGVGFGVGFLLNAMGANAKILRKQGKQQEAAVLENQVKEYEDNIENPKITSGNKISAKNIVTQGAEIGIQKAIENLDRDLANNVITPEQHQEGIVFAEKAAQVVDKIPETVMGESRIKSVELLVERNDIKQTNQDLLQQKQTTDEAYHAGIDEEIKINEERIKKIDSEVYNIAKNPLEEVTPIELESEKITPTNIETVEKISSVMPYVIEDRDIVEPVIEKIKNNELVNEEDLYNAAQVLENLQSKTDNESLKNLINPVIDKILTYENQSKTTVGTVTQKGAITRVGTDVRKKTVSKALGQFEGSTATITDRDGKTVKGYLKSEEGTYNLYDKKGNQIASIGEKQITDRDVVLPSKDVVPNPITLDKNGNIKSITLQLQKVNEEIGVLPDRLITIDFQDAEKALDYAIQLRAEQVGEFSDPEFEEIISQVEQEIPISKTKEDENIQDKEQPRKQPVQAADQRAEQKRKEESERDAAKRKEVKETLINLRNEGVLVTADKSILGKLKKAVGIKEAPMTDAEIDAQMSLLDAMAKVWKQTTGLDNFYDTFIADIKKGDVKAFRNKGGVLFQNTENPIALVSRVTLALFEIPQFQKMIGQMVNPQSIADLIKSNGKQIEKDIINDVLNFEKYKGVKRISFDEFRDDVETQIMKLEKIRSSSYASYGQDNLGDNEDYGTTQTVIFNSPINHGETGHFSGDFKNTQIEKRNWELKQIPGTDTWVAMDKDMPSGTSQDQIQNYVGTAGTQETVQNWIAQREVPSMSSEINKGLFGHIRTWFNKRTSVFTVAELQSDVFQKMKADKLLADAIPKDEIDEYMNKNFWIKFNKEYSDKLVKDLNLKVISFKDIPTIKKENLKEIAKYERALETVKNNIEFDAITKELKRLDRINKGIEDLTTLGISFKSMENTDGVVVFDKEGDYIRYKEFDSSKLGMSYGEHEKYTAINNAAREISDRFNASVYGGLSVRKTNGDLIYFENKEQLEEYVKDMYGRNPREYFAEMKNMYMDKTEEFKKEEQKYIQKRIEEQKAKFTSIQKQFIASQKFHEIRLLREAFKNAAEEGAEVVRFPSPYTLAIIEGYVNKEGESGTPYEIINGDSDRLDFGDVISMDGNRYYVLDSTSVRITVAPQDSTYSWDVDEYKSSETDNRVSELKYHAKNHFADLDNITLQEVESYEEDEWMASIVKKILKEKFADIYDEEVNNEEYEGKPIDEVTISWDDIESILSDKVYDEYDRMGLDELFDGYGDVYSDGWGNTVLVVESRGQVEQLNQPDEYDAVTNKNDFENELSDDQKTVVNKYKELNKIFGKLRKDARSVVDDNDMEWIETNITDEDRQNPIIAFQQEGGNIKGAIDFVNDNKASVYVFDGADISTLAHEFTGHLGRRFLEKLAESNEAFAKDYESIKKWAGVKDDTWSTRAEEKFARAFERYLREGKAPTKALTAVFENLKKWLTQIYNTIKGSSIDIELTQEVRDVFGGLLGAKAEGTLAEEYENIPKEGKLSTKNAVKTLINDNFEEIKKQLENKKICQ